MVRMNIPDSPDENHSTLYVPTIKFYVRIIMALRRVYYCNYGVGMVVLINYYSVYWLAICKGTMRPYASQQPRECCMRQCKREPLHFLASPPRTTVSVLLFRRVNRSTISHLFHVHTTRDGNPDFPVRVLSTIFAAILFG